MMGKNHDWLFFPAHFLLSSSSERKKAPGYGCDNNPVTIRDLSIVKSSPAKNIDLKVTIVWWRHHKCARFDVWLIEATLQIGILCRHATDKWISKRGTKILPVGWPLYDERKLTLTPLLLQPGSSLMRLWRLWQCDIVKVKGISATS